MNWDAISNAIESFRDGPWDAPIHIILIIIFAFVATKVASIAINRVVNRATKKSTEINFSNLGNTTDIQNVSDQLLENRVSQRANALGSLARSTAVIAIWTVAVLTIMTEVGINVGPLLASAGVLGVVIGFGQLPGSQSRHRFQQHPYPKFPKRPEFRQIRGADRIFVALSAFLQGKQAKWQSGSSRVLPR